MSQNPATGTLVNPPSVSRSAICGTIGAVLALASVTAMLVSEAYRTTGLRGDPVNRDLFEVLEVFGSLTVFSGLAALVLGGIGLLRREAHPERAGVAVGVGAVAFVTVVHVLAQWLAFMLLHR